MLPSESTKRLLKSRYELPIGLSLMNQNIKSIQIGRYIIDTWYFSPFPKEMYPNGHTDCVCEWNELSIMTIMMMLINDDNQLWWWLAVHLWILSQFLPHIWRTSSSYAKMYFLCTYSYPCLSWITLLFIELIIIMIRALLVMKFTGRIIFLSLRSMATATTTSVSTLRIYPTLPSYSLITKPFILMSLHFTSMWLQNMMTKAIISWGTSVKRSVVKWAII